MEQKLENKRSLALSVTLILTTCFIYSATVTEPVNAPKLAILGTLTFLIFGLLGVGVFLKTIQVHKVVSIALAFFLGAGFASLIFTNTNFVDSFFGVFGRNTGYLTYFLLAGIFFVSITITKMSNVRLLLNAFVIASLVNLAYSLMQALGVDFMPWKSSFNTPVLGTFGNPNFIGAFMGISAAIHFAIAMQGRVSKRYRVAYLSFGILSLVVVEQSNAVQGFVVFVAALFWIFFLQIRARSTRAYYSYAYMLVIGISGVLGFMGINNQGPFAMILYKPSITFRGEYWYAGIQMGLNNLLNGVGWDSYGTYYRLFRSDNALVNPGVNTVSNAAHNVFIDVFASGGLPLLLAYFTLTVCVLVSLVRQVIRRNDFDITFVILSTVWLGYQLQSIVSINQIGLAIWGWVFGGAILAYEKISTQDKGITYSILKIKQPPAKINGKREIPAGSFYFTWMRSILLATLGLLISVQPLVVDSKWRAGLVSKDPTRIEEAVKSWPPVQNNYIVAATLFTNNNLLDKGLEFINEAIRLYPESYDVYATAVKMPQVSQALKLEAFNKLLLLDPRNEELKKMEFK